MMPDIMDHVSGVGDSGCWPWTGQIDRYGYGRRSGKLAHRLVYERLVGTIPPGLHLDHQCHSLRQADEVANRDLASRDRTIAQLGASNARLLAELDVLRNSESLAEVERDRLRARVAELEAERDEHRDRAEAAHNLHANAEYLLRNAEYLLRNAERLHQLDRARIAELEAQRDKALSVCRRCYESDGAAVVAAVVRELLGDHVDLEAPIGPQYDEPATYAVDALSTSQRDRQEPSTD